MHKSTALIIALAAILAAVVRPSPRAALGQLGPEQVPPGRPSADSYEPDDTWQDAEDINPIPGIQYRTLSPAGDVDWAKLTVPPGQWSADFMASGPTPSRIRLSLYDQNISPLATNDDDGTVLISRTCGVDPLPGGVYYMRVEEVTGAETDYNLVWNYIEDCSQLPDLEPYANPEDKYAEPITPNSIRHTKTATTTLYAGKPTYFDWFFINNGPGEPPGKYYSRVWVDDLEAFAQHENPINAGDVGGGADWMFTVPSPGWHTVRFETDADGDVPESDETNNVWEKDFYWAPVNGWWAEFYNNEDLAGDPVLVRDDPVIDFEWQSASPGPGVNADHFSVRWTRNVDFTNGPYRFNLSRDDGMAFFIDGVEKLYEWHYGVADHEVVQSLSGGSHALKLEAMDIDGYATAKLDWERCYSLTMTTAPENGGRVDVWPEPNCGDQWYTKDTQVTLTAKPDTNAGYRFDHWSGAASGATNPYVITLNGDKTITAHFSQECYSLSVYANPAAGGNVNAGPPPNCDGGDYLAGTQVTLTAMPNTDASYHFDHWSGALSGSGTTRTLTMDGDKTVTAHFGQDCYSLTVNVDPTGGGAVQKSPSAACYSAGTQVTLTATANAGYRFDHWSGAADGSTNPYVITLNGDKTITAHFSQECYSLSVYADPTAGAVQTSPNEDCYPAGTQVTLTATANAGHRFDHWSGAASGSTNPYVITMNGDKSVTAHFSQECYSLSVYVDPTAGGAVQKSPNEDCYPAGTEVTLTAAPAAGYHFSRWNGSIGGSENPRTLTMGGDKTVTANFTRECYSLSIDVFPPSGGRVDVDPPPNCSAAQYSAHTQVMLRAIRNNGYHFEFWSFESSDGSSTSFINPRALLMDGDKRVTANFIRVTEAGFLPTLMFGRVLCQAGPEETEPNDTVPQAGLPLCLNGEYRGHREDDHDFFAIDITTEGELVVNLTTHQNGGGVQLILQYASTEVADFDVSLGDDLQVGLAARPARYFIHVYTAKPNGEPYTLRVSFTPKQKQ